MTAAVRSVRDFRGVVDGDFPVVLANSVLSYLFAVVGELDDRVTVFFNELPEEYISSVRFFANIRSVTVPAIVALWIVGVVQHNPDCMPSIAAFRLRGRMRWAIEKLGRLQRTNKQFSYRYLHLQKIYASSLVFRASA